MGFVKKIFTVLKAYVIVTFFSISSIIKAIAYMKNIQQRFH